MMTSTASSPLAAARTNWSGNLAYHAARLVEPRTVAELQALVLASPAVKALGVGHSFNPIADTPGTHISLRHLAAISLDRHAGTVTVGAGVRYGQLAPWLHARGLAVHNLASLPHISVAGACATGTHGSGSSNGCLSTAVAAIEFVNGRGEHVQLNRERDPDVFPGAVVALGALGVVTSLTLKVVPTFAIAQSVYQRLSFDRLPLDMDAIYRSGYSVSLFTNWQGHCATQAWVKRISTSGDAVPADFFGATAQTEKLHPLDGHSAEHCTEQFGVPGPWFERLPHFRVEFTPSSGEELQSEYFVAREHALGAIAAVESLRDQISPHLIVSELRTVAADDLWLSMAEGRDSLAIHFTWKLEPGAVEQVLPQIEAKLAPLDARPHWAKLFTTSAGRLQALYPRLADFRMLRHQHDPDRRFENAFLRGCLG